eukprot:jgi/Psemu1/292546/fgenesh1_pg.1121_\
MATAENANTVRSDSIQQQHPQHNRLQLQKNSSGTSRDSTSTGNNNNGGGGGSDDDNNGLIQIIESEVWDASENKWKGASVGTDGGNRWTTVKGRLAPSPTEVVPPEGWEFLGEWKIVVNSGGGGGSGGPSNGGSGGGGGGDSKGWEYQFQYLQPPRRRRIWLRSLTPVQLPPVPPSRVVSPVRPLPKPGKTILPRVPRSKIKRALNAVREDFNYKGLGFNLFKSFIFPSSIGVALRLPLSTNFDTFDRNPAWPIISSSACVYYPPMVGGFLSTSFHVEWVKWLFLCTLGLVPRCFFWVLYRMVLPVVWAVASIALFPLRGFWSLPPVPTKLPRDAWWTGRNVAKPQYNSDLSERIGCSLSYRWSRKRGYEWRVSYFHSYLPTLLVYQQMLSKLQATLSSSDKPNESKPTPLTQGKLNWLRKHTASLGVSTSGPIPDTPRISCSGNLSLSGLYWGTKSASKTSSAASNSPAISAATTANGYKSNKTDAADAVLSKRLGGSEDDDDDENTTDSLENYKDRMSPASARVRTVVP